MDVYHLSNNGVSVSLSRRNLETLLKKLDFNATLPADAEGERSACCIMRETDDGLVIVTAEENDVHYEGRLPGVMLDNDTGLLK